MESKRDKGHNGYNTCRRAARLAADESARASVKGSIGSPTPAFQNDNKHSGPVGTGFLNVKHKQKQMASINLIIKQHKAVASGSSFPSRRGTSLKSLFLFH